MIRKIYVQQRVLELYRKMPGIRYPIDPIEIEPYLPVKCRFLSYEKMAEVSHSTIEEVAALCGSHSGASHYDTEKEHCLILFQDSENKGRVRWTQSHEIGHVCLGHLQLKEYGRSIKQPNAYSKQMEEEADFFAWNLLAPLPIMREMNIETIEETQMVFGLSFQAAALHFARYQKWLENHRKTAWENDILAEYRKKRGVPKTKSETFLREPVKRIKYGHINFRQP